MPVVEPFEAAIKAVSPADIAALAKDGLIENIGDEKQPDWQAKWTIKTTVTRRQLFPAGRAIRVEHSYVPMAGGSVGGGLNREYRREADFADKRRTYCIDDDFLRAFDGRMARAKNNYAYGETWLSYVLKTGANWAGPIRDFRLVVDKGTADNLVSFCAKGVKKIGPTTFEVRHTDFVPTQDLNILIVEFHRD
jgi:hypothetical protein